MSWGTWCKSTKLFLSPSVRLQPQFTVNARCGFVRHMYIPARVHQLCDLRNHGMSPVPEEVLNGRDPWKQRHSPVPRDRGNRSHPAGVARCLLNRAKVISLDLKAWLATGGRYFLASLRGVDGDGNRVVDHRRALLWLPHSVSLSTTLDSGTERIPIVQKAQFTWRKSGQDTEQFNGRLSRQGTYLLQQVYFMLSSPVWTGREGSLTHSVGLYTSKHMVGYIISCSQFDIFHI